MDRFAALFLVCIGATCIYAGYRLFCDLPALSDRSRRSAILAVNVIPGLVLALVGTVLVTTQSRVVLARHTPPRHRDSGVRGTSWQPVSPRIVRPASS